ncbi:hypothetical protein D3C84_1194520 [compost metagenome]
MLDHHYGIASIDQALQLYQQAVDIRRVQAGSRLVEHIQAATSLASLKLRGELDALRFAPRQLRGGLPKAQITQPDVPQ